MLKRLKESLKRTRLFAFNDVNRDAWVARQAAALPRGSKVLDVGAGSSPYRELFCHCEYRTADFQQLSGDQLRNGAYARIDYVCDATSIPVPSASFDAVLCTEMLEHVPDPAAVIREFVRIVKPHGRVILTAPLGSGLHQEPFHFYGGFTPFWYQKVLTEAGFEEVQVEANAGSFAFYAQESIRFLQLSSPITLRANLAIRMLWAPVWLALCPLLGLFVPLVAHQLDRFERDRRFTVGYFVTASRASSPD